MPTMYLADGYGRDAIQAVEVERFNDKSVWIRGLKGTSRRNRASDWGTYYETWQAAKDALLARAEARVNSLRRQLERANGALGNVKGLREPAQPASTRR